MTAVLLVAARRLALGLSPRDSSTDEVTAAVIAGFFTGGALAVRGGVKAARNSAIGCAVLLAVIEGVGIGFQRMMAENTRLDVGVWLLLPPFSRLNDGELTSFRFGIQVPPPPQQPAEGSRVPALA